MTPVLQVVVSTRPGGGPEHVRTLARGLGAHGFTPVIAGPRDGAMFDAYRADGFDTVAVRTDSLAPGAFVALSRLIRARGIRLVHTHGKGAGLHGRLAARAAGVPAIHSFHGIHFERHGGAAKALYLTLEKTLARGTAAVVNVSAAQETEGLALGLFTAAQSRVIPNGVDAGVLRAEVLTRATARAELGIDEAAAVIGCAARFDPVKGLALLVRTMASVDGAVLALIGDGVDAAALRALAAPLGARVVMPGEIRGAARLFSAFDVYAAPSAKEGLPVAVLEAIALGVPVVASDIAAHREVLGADYDGLVPRTSEALGAALRRALADAAWREAAAARGRARALLFDAGRMVSTLAGLYRETLAGNAA